MLWGWDTHQGLEKQGKNFGDLFTYLGGIMADLEGRVSHTGAPLAEEVTIVVFSEMGRDPGSTPGVGGITGPSPPPCSWGPVFAATRPSERSTCTDKVSRSISRQAIVRDGGTALIPEHLGATLLALGDVDPGEFLDDPSPIEAVMS